MSRLLCRLVPLAVAAVLAATGPAAALFRETGRAPIVVPDPPEGYQPALSAATGRLCVKQCPADDLPCDPPSYKAADGRCSTQWH